MPFGRLRTRLIIGTSYLKLLGRDVKFWSGGDSLLADMLSDQCNAKGSIQVKGVGVVILRPYAINPPSKFRGNIAVVGSHRYSVLPSPTVLTSELLHSQPCALQRTSQVAPRSEI